MASEQFSAQDSALLKLGQYLQTIGYDFTTATPATHSLVNARPKSQIAKSLEDVFGWTRPFHHSLLPELVADLAERAGIVEANGGLWRSRVRFSTLGLCLFAHSAFPTNDADVVFFGPDTYRFARLLRDASKSWDLPARVRLIDIGCGSGAGGIYLSLLLAQRCDVDLVLCDINPQALRFSCINSALNGCSTIVASSDVLKDIDGTADIIIANPPYLVDRAERLYRHGGGEYGISLSLRIVEEGLGRLRAGGRLALYTGSPIVEGTDMFLQAAKPLLSRSGLMFAYDEIDPDVFGEELSGAPYERVDRIAVVALSVRQRKSNHAAN